MALRTVEVPQSSILTRTHALLSIFLLFLNYFIAQFDKFLYSYFQPQLLADLSLSPAQYGILNGYATGIAYALLALPIAFLSDYSLARVWILTISSAWWSLCFVLQSLATNFVQILLGRIGMGLGQAAVEALSVSLISDLVGARREWVWIAEGALYVGVYVGEAVNAQISTAFKRNGLSWRIALRGVGIAGLVIALAIRIVIREPRRRASLLQHGNHVDRENDDAGTSPSNRPLSGTEKRGIASPVSPSSQDIYATEPQFIPASGKLGGFALAKSQLRTSLHHGISMHSFALLTLAASARQLSGNVFGYYMPSYLSSLYPSFPNLLSNYGIIVGVVGSFAVLLGGILSAWAVVPRRGREGWVTFPLYLTGIGGMVSSFFVLLMIYSNQIRGGDEDSGSKVLYATMTLAYLTAELWLGAFAALLVLLFPPRLKTFLLAIYQAVIILVYSSGPEIVGLALQNVDPGSPEYIERTKVVLAVMIPVGYWIAGVLFLLAVAQVRKDVKEMHVSDWGVELRVNSSSRKAAFAGCLTLLAAIVVVLFALSIVYGA